MSPANGWVSSPIGDVCEVILGQSPLSSTYNDEGLGLPFFQGSGEFGEISPTVKKWCNRPRKIAENGDVLLSVRAPVGPTNICQGRSAIGRGLAAIRYPFPGGHKFLFYFFKSIENVVSQSGTGSTFSAITKSEVNSIRLQLPPLPEQHRIVTKIEELFSKLDAGVEALRKVKVEIKRYRQAVLKHAFEGRLTEAWREKRPAVTSETLDVRSGAEGLRNGDFGLRTVSGSGERIAAETVHGYQANLRLKELRTVLESRIRHSDVTYSPHEVLKDFMLEMVLDGVDLTNASLIDAVVSAFMLAVSEKIPVNDRLRNYLKWARDSVDALKSEGLESRVLQAQLDAWVRHSDDNLREGKRTITMTFGSTDSTFEAIHNALEMQQLEKEGIRGFRERVLDAETRVAYAGGGESDSSSRLRNVGTQNDISGYETASVLLERIWAERKKLLGKKYKEPRHKDGGQAEPIDTSELPELPEGWVWATVRSIGEIETGTTPPKSEPKYYGRDFPFYKPSDLNAGNNTRKSIDGLSNEGMKHARLLPRGSVLVTCIGATIGKTGLIRSPGASNQQINAIVPSTGIIAEYLYYLCISPDFQTSILENASSTTLPILNKKKFEQLSLPIPGTAEQKVIVSEIDNRFSVVGQIEATVDRSLKEAERLRQSILKRAFEGKLVPQDPTDEPASVLLERIKAEKAKRAEESMAKREKVEKVKKNRKAAPKKGGSRKRS